MDFKFQFDDIKLLHIASEPPHEIMYRHMDEFKLSFIYIYCPELLLEYLLATKALWNKACIRPAKPNH